MANGVIGSLAGFNHSRQTIRATPNPLDKATIVSIYPKSIREIKETISPGIFEISAGSFENPALLVVGSSSWWRDIGEGMPTVEIPNGAIYIADSFINDWIGGLPGVTDNSKPGLFFIPGDIKLDRVKEEYGNALKDCNVRQRNWFNNLLTEADKEWAKTNGNPKAISDLMKMAARELSKEDRPWMSSSVDIKKVPCVACGNLRNPSFPICPSCNRVVDVVLAGKLGIIDPSVKK